MKTLIAAVLFLMLGAGAASAKDQCPAEDDYVNDGIIQPQIPRAKQLDRFAEILQSYGPKAAQPFHGTSMVLGDSHVAYYPEKSLEADFSAAPQDIAIFGVDGTTAEELWWMIGHMASGFDWTDEQGVHQGWVEGMDLSKVVQVLVPTFGGNSLKRATDSTPAQIAQQEAGMLKTLSGEIGRRAKILMTERLEMDEDGCSPGKEIPLNARVKALAARSGGRFDYLATPRWFVPKAADGAPHCGYDHTDGYYFVLPKAAHHQPPYYRTFLDPVVSAYFHNLPQPAPGGEITATCHPEGETPANTQAGAYQGPF